MDNNNNISGYNPNTGQPVVNNYDQPVKKTKNGNLKILAIVAAVIVFLAIVIFVVVSLVKSFSGNKLVCKSNEGNITIMYNESGINGYTANGISYDMDEQRDVAEQIGIDNYISQFTTWFETNTTGTCTVKEK